MPNTDIAEKIDIGIPLANSRWENFALAVAAGETRSEAWRRAGFADTNSTRTLAARLFAKVLIKDRVEQIRNAIADSRIMTMRDRKIRLSEIARANIKDFHNKQGVLDPFAPGVENSAAIAQIEQEYDETGLEAYPTKIKLHSPIPAIDMLNKLDGAYPASKVEIAGAGGGPIKIEDTRIKLLGILAKISVRLATREEDDVEP